MIAPARVAAYEVLRAVSKGAADLPTALTRARAHLGDERDRALASEIATGTLRWQAAFDHIVAEFSRRSVARLDPEVLDILRTAIFQLLHLDRVPASAAVSDAVSLTKKAGKRSAAPLVNAVLRRVSRERDRLPLPPRPSGDIQPGQSPLSVPGDTQSGQSPLSVPGMAQLDYLSITLSHPRWLVARWLNRYGFKATENWLKFNNRPAPLTIRANRLRTSPSELREALAACGVQTVPGRYGPDTLVVGHGNPLLTPLASEGLFFVQDEASQVVTHLVAARPDDRVLDACASPGGKTTAIAAAMEDHGLIVATDIRGRRVDLLARTAKMSGASSIRIVQADAAGLPFGTSKAAPRFDWVLVDAPCSGLGTIRRDPDLRWRRTEADLSRFAERQRQMLRETTRVLRPGGKLVYSTCSSEPEENEEVVAAVVRDGLLAPANPTALPPSMLSLIDDSGHLRTYPFMHGLEAFFGAVLQKI